MGKMVSVQGVTGATDKIGRFMIRGLKVLDQPDPNVNLFWTVPKSWKINPELITNAGQLFGQMPEPYRRLFNAIFWDQERFRRYCQAPSSLKHHHSWQGGNLDHSVEVARMMAEVRSCKSDPGFRILLGLLHDAGKAIEYECGSNGKFVMSDQGKLVGHAITITQWITEAITKYRLSDIPAEHVMAINHCLHSAPHAEYLGIRRPCMIEAELLSQMDRISVDFSFKKKEWKGEGGWGGYSERLKTKTYTISALPAADPFAI